MADNAALITNFDDLLIGRKLGGCLIQARAGKGGMATVYSAIRDRDEAYVAIKVIANDIAAANDFGKRFQREARLMSTLDHPHILPVYQYGTHGEISYLVMRLLDGGSLNQVVNKQRLDVAYAITLMEQIGSALDYAHERGIVHRDLKPANVLLDTEGNAYLTDFGIAKWMEETTGLTVTGMVVGTPAYMAPEQWRTEPVDARTDVYAFGVMIFQMLTGQLPFVARTPFSLMYKHLDEPPPSVTLFNAELPSTIDFVVERALAKVPEDRYASAGDLVISVREVLGHEEAETGPRTAKLLVLEGERTYATDENIGRPEGESRYDSVDVGVRTLLSRARETAREAKGDLEVLAQAVIRYVQDLREQAKYKQSASEGPYKALESYDVMDNRLFFGREMAIDAMLARSPFAKFTALHAESGAGKTSLIRAGLMPRLLAGGFLPLYVAIRRRPPHEAIKHLLLPDPSVAPGLAGASLHTYLKGVQRAAGERRELFIFFDQFETFFTDVFSDEQRAQFIGELAEVLGDASLKVRVTLALRTEYFGMLASFQPAIPQPFEKELFLRRLTRDEAERAIIKPAQAQQYDYEDGLVNLILNDLADTSNEIAPPHLQLVGTALVEQLPPDRKLITKADYLEAGGAKGVLRSYLERLLSRLTAENRRPARVIIESLVRGDMTRDVRTPASLKAELEMLGTSTRHFDEILTTLRENHILRVVETADGLAYELVHDYLALQVQLDPDSIARKAAQELLERRLADYERFGSLLTREELDVVKGQMDWLRLDNKTRAFIKRTEWSYRRQRRLVSGLIAAAVLGVIGVLIVGLFAANRESKNRQERLIEQQTAEAQIAAERDDARITESLMLADLSQRQLDIDTMTGLNLAIRALTPRDRPYVPEAELALSRAVQAVNEKIYVSTGKKIHGAVWSQDEQRFLLWSNDGTARIFDAASGAEMVRMDAEPETLMIAAAWSPDEALLLAGDQNGGLYVFDAASGERLVYIGMALGDNRTIRGVAWNPAGQRFAAWNDNFVAGIWNSAGELVALIEGVDGVWKPDGSALLTVANNDFDNDALADFRALVWDSESGELQTTLVGHQNNVVGARWSADGSRILTWSDDATAVLWNAVTSERVATLERHSDAVSSAQWSPDGQWIATTSFDGQVIVWNGTDGAYVGTLSLADAITGVAWSPDSTRLLTYGATGRALGVWSAATQALSSEPVTVFTNEQVIAGVAWSPDGAYFLAYSRSGDIRIFGVDGSVITQLLGHGDGINSAVWNHDAMLVLSSGDDGTARVWQVLEMGLPVGEGEVQRFAAPDGQVFVAGWNANESQIASGYEDGAIRIWDATSGEEMAQLVGHEVTVKVLAWNPSQNRLASGDINGRVIIWDAQAGQPLFTLEHGGEIFSIQWNRAGTQLLVSSDDGRVHLWDGQTGTEILNFELAEAGIGINSAVWNGDETRLLATTDDGFVQVWELSSQQRLLNIQAATIVYAAWSPDESLIAAWGQVGFGGAFAAIYDAATGEERFLLTPGHSARVVNAAWSADGTRLVTASDDETAVIWDTATGTALFVLRGFADAVLGATWNGESSRLMTRSADGQVRVWDAVRGVEVLRIDGHHEKVNMAGWNGDETLILTASSDGTARLWRSWPVLDELINEANGLITRPLTPEQLQAFFLASTTP